MGWIKASLIAHTHSDATHTIIDWLIVYKYDLSVFKQQLEVRRQYQITWQFKNILK